MILWEKNWTELDTFHPVQLKLNIHKFVELKVRIFKIKTTCESLTHPLPLIQELLGIAAVQLSHSPKEQKKAGQQHYKLISCQEGRQGNDYMTEYSVYV